MSGLSPEMLELSRSVAASLEQFQKFFNSQNDAQHQPAVQPALTQGVGDGQQLITPSRRILTGSDMLAVRRELRKKSTEELEMLFIEQARQRDTGVPLDMWLNRSGYAAQERFDGGNGLRAQVDPDIRRALDSASASALIRQDLEPILLELYVRQFPAFERVRKEPANGLTHTYQQITAYGDAQWMGELGTVTDDKSTYVRKTTNIGILATRRGVSLKSTFAITAGGMNWNAEQLELQGGLRSMAHKMQQTLFGYNADDSGGNALNELGLYDANGFTGLRSILNSARVKNVDPETAPTTTGNFRRAINQACIEIMQLGGQPSMIWGNPFDKEKFDNQQDQNVRYMAPENLLNVSVGVVTNAVNTIFGPLPFGVVPGDSIAHYTSSQYSSNDVRDVYILDESTITFPFLGTDGPTVLDIPIGISGQLTHLYIVFGMWGLAVKAPGFSNKVRVKV